MFQFFHVFRLDPQGSWRTYNGFIVSIVPKAHAGCVTALLAAPAGGTYYSGGHDGVIRLWRATNGLPLGAMVGTIGDLS